MRCPACGAFYEVRSARCPECGAIQDASPIEPLQQAQSEQVGVGEETILAKTIRETRDTTKLGSSLIEFPGVNRSAIPEWRKELGERVREVQEKRAREAISQSGAAEPLFGELESNLAPMLELLPQAEAAPPNPLVVAALRRIERAHAQSTSNIAVSTAIVYEEQTDPELDLLMVETAEDVTPAVAKPEKVHNLAVVPAPEVVTSSIPQEPRKPRRIIDDQNDPALNYLDSIPRSLTVEIREYRTAPVYLRILGALTDLIFVCFLSSPILALTQLTNLEWRNPRVIGFAAITFLVLGFLYLTISTAFTGRTIGMKLFSLRVVDARTGLIPTGSQSAGRAALYMLSLAFAGIPLMFGIVNSERLTAHDHFTRTAVIRV
ncbi:MAG TPA: RDD family protein [Pyrinomonadaceae bacterium]